MSPLTPHWVAVKVVGADEGMIYQAPLEGRHTASSALPSPSKSPLPPDKDWSAVTKSRRPWFRFKEGSSGAAFATAVAASDSVTALRRACNSAAPPETKGALKEVPQPAAYVLKG